MRGLGSRCLPAGVVAERVRRLAFEGDLVLLETSRERGKLVARQTVPGGTERPLITPVPEAEIVDNRPAVMGRLKPFKAESVRKAGSNAGHPAWSVSTPAGNSTSARRGQGGDRPGEPGGCRVHHRCRFRRRQPRRLRSGDRAPGKGPPRPGCSRLVIGGSRKVTEELHVLPLDRQIGQSGVSVNPRLFLAIGISGAPQHLNYIGSQATIIAFNRDPEAPIMTLNRRQPRPRVFPVVGDLFGRAGPRGGSPVEERTVVETV